MTSEAISELADIIMERFASGDFDWYWDEKDLMDLEGALGMNIELMDLASYSSLTCQEEVLLFAELQKRVAAAIELQNDMLEDDARTWIQWMDRGEESPVDDGHPLTKQLLSRIRSIRKSVVELGQKALIA